MKFLERAKLRAGSKKYKGFLAGVLAVFVFVAAITVVTQKVKITSAGQHAEADMQAIAEVDVLQATFSAATSASLNTLMQEVGGIDTELGNLNMANITTPIVYDQDTQITRNEAGTIPFFSDSTRFEHMAPGKTEVLGYLMDNSGESAINLTWWLKSQMDPKSTNDSSGISNISEVSWDGQDCLDKVSFSIYYRINKGSWELLNSSDILKDYESVKQVGAEIINVPSGSKCEILYFSHFKSTPYPTNEPRNNKRGDNVYMNSVYSWFLTANMDQPPVQSTTP